MMAGGFTAGAATGPVEDEDDELEEAGADDGVDWPSCAHNVTSPKARKPNRIKPAAVRYLSDDGLHEKEIGTATVKDPTLSRNPDFRSQTRIDTSV